MNYTCSSVKPFAAIDTCIRENCSMPAFYKVLSCIPSSNNDQEVTVNFATAGIKRLLANLARMEKIETSSDSW